MYVVYVQAPCGDLDVQRVEHVTPDQVELKPLENCFICGAEVDAIGLFPHDPDSVATYASNLSQESREKFTAKAIEMSGAEGEYLPGEYLPGEYLP